MTWKRSILVVANVTAVCDASEQLIGELTARFTHNPATVKLIVPAPRFGRGREALLGTLAEAISRLQYSGLTAEGSVGDWDPLIAVNDAWDPMLYDEIIVSAVGRGASRWLHAGLPERIAKLTGAPVTHLVGEPSKPAVESGPATVRARQTMGPLSVLSWGGCSSSSTAGGGRTHSTQNPSSRRRAQTPHPDRSTAPVSQPRL
jgi:hypothetical protein